MIGQLWELVEETQTSSENTRDQLRELEEKWKEEKGIRRLVEKVRGGREGGRERERGREGEREREGEGGRERERERERGREGRLYMHTCTYKENLLVFLLLEILILCKMHVNLLLEILILCKIHVNLLLFYYSQFKVSLS